MEKQKVWDIYDADYAAGYNDFFLLKPYSKASTDFELSVLRQLVNKETKWLDIGCGTGYFLSQFPGTQRAGYDLSPAMLAEAQKANPDALLFKQGDFRNFVQEWEGKWSLVSCMWSAYAYVETLAHVEQVVANMIKWASYGGDIFIPVVDVEDFRQKVIIIPYAEPNLIYGGTTYVTSCNWTWIEEDERKVHKDMVAPHVEHFVRLLQLYFETVEIIRYPPYQDGWGSRKAVLAKNKLRVPEGSSHVANIIRQPYPPNSYQAYQETMMNNRQSVPSTITPSALSNKQLLYEVYNRLKNGSLLKALSKKIVRSLFS